MRLPRPGTRVWSAFREGGQIDPPVQAWRPPHRSVPRDYQVAALEVMRSSLNDENPRATVAMACGTGKTTTSLRIIEGRLPGALRRRCLPWPHTCTRPADVRRVDEQDDPRLHGNGCVLLTDRCGLRGGPRDRARPGSLVRWLHLRWYEHPDDRSAAPRRREHKAWIPEIGGVLNLKSYDAMTTASLAELAVRQLAASGRAMKKKDVVALTSLLASVVIDSEIAVSNHHDWASVANHRIRSALWTVLEGWPLPFGGLLHEWSSGWDKA